MVGILDLAGEVAKEFNIPKSQAKTQIQFLFKAMADHLLQGETVAVQNFAHFKPNMMAARKVRNLQTGEEIQMPASAKISMSVASNLKAAVKAQVTEAMIAANKPGKAVAGEAAEA